MACSQRNIQKESHEQWQALFPCDHATLEGSCLFIKKLLAVAVSTVTYARNIFPEEAYGNRYLAGIKLKLLTEGSNSTGASKIIELIRGCYDAVEKKYLQQLKIGICVNAKNTDEAVEAFNFRFNYTDESCVIGKIGKKSQKAEDDSLVSETIKLLKNIFFINDQLGALPNNCFLTLKLLYNDDITPPEYEPPGFQPAENEKFSFVGESINIMLGKVSTPYHSCKLVVKTIQKTFEIQKTAIPEDPLISQSGYCSFTNMIQDSSIAESSFDDAMAKAVKINGLAAYGNEKWSEKPLVSNDKSSLETAATQMSQETSCPCTNSKDSKLPTVACTICFKRQHQVCYGFFGLEDIPDYFTCVKCFSRNLGRNIQNDNMYLYMESDQEALCLIRKALVLCTTLQSVSVNTLKTKLYIDNETAKALHSKLKKEGFIKQGTKKNVNMERIQNDGIPEYFHSQNNFVQGIEIENKENNQTPENLNRSMQNLSMKTRTSNKPNEREEEIFETPLRVSKRKKTPKKVDDADDWVDFSQNSRKRARKVSVDTKNSK